MRFLILLLLFSSHTGFALKTQPDSLDRAKKIVSRLDYIPFSSIRDGCFARALYMGMELTIKNIPVNNSYLIGKLRPKGARWKWHVAPMILGPEKLPYILDPSFSKSPIPANKWVKMSNPVSKTKLYVAPISHYKKETVGRLAKKKLPGYTWRSQVDEIAEVPLFKVKDIANACKTAFKHIGKEDLNSRQKRMKRLKLLRRTRYLVKTLDKLGKLSGDAKSVTCQNIALKI